MALKLDWRQLIRYQVEETSRRHGGYDPYIYEGHIEEAFSAAVGFIKKHHPSATLNYLGSDLGGELYEVVELD